MISMIFIIALGLSLFSVSFIFPVEKAWAKEKDISLRDRVKQEKLSFLRGTYPILRQIPDATLEEDYNIDSLYYRTCDRLVKEHHENRILHDFFMENSF